MKVRLLVVFLLLSLCLSGCNQNSQTKLFSQPKSQPTTLDSVTSAQESTTPISTQGLISSPISTQKPNDSTSEQINANTKRKLVSGQIDLTSVSPVVIATSTFKTKEKISLQTNTITPHLEPISESSNSINDQSAWIKYNALDYPYYKVDNKYLSCIATEPLPDFVPKAYQGISLSEASFDAKNIYLYYYNLSPTKDSYLCVISKSDLTIKYIYNFTNFHYLNDDFHQEVPRFAIEENGILYVSNYHMTYGKDTNYKNAYLTAIDTKTNKVLWRTGSLVSNSRNFLIRDNYIISGYGFTSEDDYLYIINKSSGKTLSELKVKSSPEFIIEKESKIYVRCYDTDYIFGF